MGLYPVVAALAALALAASPAHGGCSAGVTNVYYDIPKTFSAIEIRDLDGVLHKMSEYDGKVKLVTNVASLWGLTHQHYIDFVELYSRYHDQGFEILGFPSQQFRRQEFDSNEQIKRFVARYNVTFPLFEVIDVNGPGTHPVFLYCKWHSDELWNDGVLGDISWNFGKFLLDRNNGVYRYYTPRTPAISLEEDIRKLLNADEKGHFRDENGVIGDL